MQVSYFDLLLTISRVLKEFWFGWSCVCLHSHIWTLGGPWGLNETSPGISLLSLGG